MATAPMDMDRPWTWEEELDIQMYVNCQKRGRSYMSELDTVTTEAVCVCGGKKE